MKVVSLEERRLENSPHSAGEAFCLDCHHKWVSVAPVGVVWLECPSCGLLRGRFKFPHERDGEQWVCKCGNDLFHIKPQGMYCPNCGSWQEGFDE